MSDENNNDVPAGADENQDKPPENQGGADQKPTEGNQDKGSDDAPELYKPKGLPDHYLGENDQGTIDKMQKALDGFRKDQAKAGPGVPEKPDGYELKIDDKLSKQFMRPGEDGKDPFFEKLKGVAHKSGMSQEMFDAFISSAITDASEMFPPGTDDGESGADLDVDFVNFGGIDAAKPVIDDAIARIDGLHASGKIPDEGIVQELKMMAEYGNGLSVVRFLAQQMGEMPIPTDPVLPAGGVTEKQLNEMMEDPRYWKTKDKDFIAKVTKGFEQLYNN